MSYLQEQVKKAFERKVDHSVDCHHIVFVIKNELDVDITLEQAEKFWKWHSENYRTGWLLLCKDKDILTAFRMFIDARTKDFGV